MGVEKLTLEGELEQLEPKPHLDIFGSIRVQVCHICGTQVRKSALS